MTKFSIKIIKEPSAHAKEKGLRVGQIHPVLYHGRGENKNFLGEFLYQIQPPIGKAMYGFYDNEIKIINHPHPVV